MPKYEAFLEICKNIQNNSTYIWNKKIVQRKKYLKENNLHSMQSFINFILTH